MSDLSSLLGQHEEHRKRVGRLQSGPDEVTGRYSSSAAPVD
jgi:hypothetical protein